MKVTACSAAPSTLKLQIGFEKIHRLKLLGFFIVFVFASPVYGRTEQIVNMFSL